MNKTKCCICNEYLSIEKEYSVSQQSDNYIYLYVGHKGCLFTLESRMARGEKFEHIVINKETIGGLE